MSRAPHVCCWLGTSRQCNGWEAHLLSVQSMVPHSKQCIQFFAFALHSIQGNARARQCDWVSYVSIFNVLWCWVEYIHFTQLTHISKFNTTFNIKQLCSVQNCSVFIIITCIVVDCFIIIIIFDFDFLILILIILRVVVMWCVIVHCYVIVMRTNDCQFIQLQLTC